MKALLEKIKNLFNKLKLAHVWEDVKSTLLGVVIFVATNVEQLIEDGTFTWKGFMAGLLPMVLLAFVKVFKKGIINKVKDQIDEPKN